MSDKQILYDGIIGPMAFTLTEIASCTSKVTSCTNPERKLHSGLANYNLKRLIFQIRCSVSLKRYMNQ